MGERRVSVCKTQRERWQGTGLVWPAQEGQKQVMEDKSQERERGKSCKLQRPLEDFGFWHSVRHKAIDVVKLRIMSFRNPLSVLKRPDGRSWEGGDSDKDLPIKLAREGCNLHNQAKLEAMRES